MSRTAMVRPAETPSPAAADSSLDSITADLCVWLAATGPALVDQAVSACLDRLTTCLRLDWAGVWHDAPAASNEPEWHLSAGGTAPAPADVRRVLAGKAVTATLNAGNAFWFVRASDVVESGDASIPGLLSGAILPAVSISHESTNRWLLFLGTASEGYPWAARSLDPLRVLAAAIGQALARKSSADAARAGTLPARAPRVAESPPAHRASTPAAILASRSPAMQQALAQLEQVAGTTSTVLLLGETGVGKERVARAIHDLSARSGREMVRVSCAAIPSTLMESELFGRERGAYTGALSRQIGRFETAHGSTLLLDEIGELSLEVQSKLLRVLEDRVVERLGSNQPIKVDVRIVAATNRDLEKAVAGGTFREDLFYRLNVFPIRIPPLRERPEDVPMIAAQVVDEFANTIGKTIHQISDDSMRQMQAYSWPGNVRELRNVIERAVILCKGPILSIQLPASPSARPGPPSTRLKDVEVAHILSVLESTKWRIRGKEGAAERLGLKPSTLETRMSKLGLTRPKAC